MDFEEAMEWLYHHEVGRPDGWTRGLEHDRGLRTRWGLSERSNPDLDLELQLKGGPAADKRI